MEKELLEIDQFKYIMYNGEFPKSEVSTLVREIVEFLNNPTEMIKAKGLKIEGQFIREKMERCRKEGEKIGEKRGIIKGKIECLKYIIYFIYGEVDMSWMDECNEDQLTNALILTTKGIAYEDLQKIALSF